MKNCGQCGSDHNEKRRLCNKCRYIAEKLKDPISLAYRRLKAHAKYRGKEFSLSKQEFSEFCVKSEYNFKSGRTKYGYHVDRIDELKGYSADNIQIMTNTENVKKYLKWISRDENNKNVFKAGVMIDFKNVNNYDCPF